MITRITKDTDPASLIGRYVLRNAGMFYGAVAEPRLVVGARAKSVEVVTVPRRWSDNEKRWVVTEFGSDVRFGGEPCAAKQVRSLMFACDTLEEVDHLMSYSDESGKRYNAVLQETKKGLDAAAGMTVQGLSPSDQRAPPSPAGRSAVRLRPIGEARRDGTPILARVLDRHPMVLAFDAANPTGNPWRAPGLDAWFSDEAITGWTELPEVVSQG